MENVPSHDDIVFRVQQDVLKAVEKVGWPNISKACWGHHISIGIIRKICLWRPRRPGSGEPFESFNLGKLLDAHSWAEDVLAGRTIQGSEWRG